ncbi:MAG: Dabb family protein [Lachnospiraceae bacterium]|nr:Dabb family protein [Lachnospiraceae bacterium]
MLKHMIMWQLKDEFSEEEKREIKKEMKKGLEGLAGQIPGLLEIHVQIEGLETSNVDALLDSAFTDKEALAVYASHPKHVEVADSKIRPFTKTRMCMDYEG